MSSIGLSALRKLPQSIHLLRSYHAQGVVLGAEDVTLNRARKTPCPQEADVPVREADTCAVNSRTVPIAGK